MDIKSLTAWGTPKEIKEVENANEIQPTREG